MSRAFAEYAKSALGDKVHEALVERCLKPEIVEHISRDSTAIKGSENPRKKRNLSSQSQHPEKENKAAEHKPKEEKRLDLQRKQSAEEALKELFMFCDVGTKKNSKKGYKTVLKLFISELS